MFILQVKVFTEEGGPWVKGHCCNTIEMYEIFSRSDEN